MSPTIIGDHWDEYFCTIPFFSFEVTLENLSFNVEIALISICFFTLSTNLHKHIIARVGNLIEHIVDVLIG